MVVRRWAPLAAAWSVAAAFALTLADSHHGFDARVYAGAVHHWLYGGSLYDFGVGRRHLGFTYPPFAALVLAPLAAVPHGAVLPLMCVVNAVALVGAVTTSLRLVGRSAGARAVAVAVPLLLVLQPVWDTFTFGQVNLVLLAAVLADVRLARDDSRWAGVGVGLAAAVKLTPAVFVLLFLVVGRRGVALRAVGTTVAVSVVAALLDPGTSARFWFHALWATGRVGHQDSASNQALSGVLARLADAQDAPAALWVACAVVLTGVALVAARRAWQAGRVLEAATGMGLVGVLVTPVGWVHHLVWVVPAAVVLADRELRHPSPRRRVGMLAAGVLLTSGLPQLVRTAAGTHYSNGPAGVVAESAYALLALALAVVLVRDNADCSLDCCQGRAYRRLA